MTSESAVLIVQTRRSNAGYCFVDFSSSQAAAKALGLNGTLIPNSNRPFKLNWASGGGLADRRSGWHSAGRATMLNVTLTWY